MKSHHRDFHKVIPAVQVILQRQDGKILMMRRFNTGFSDGNYGFIGGHVEKHETPIDAAVRETKEEAGVQITPSDLEFIYVIPRINHDDHPDQQERIDFVFLCKQWQGEPRIAEADKCDHLDWFEPTELPKNIVFYLPDIIKGWQKGKYYSEHRYP